MLAVSVDRCREVEKDSDLDEFFTRVMQKIEARRKLVYAWRHRDPHAWGHDPRRVDDGDSLS